MGAIISNDNSTSAMTVNDGSSSNTNNKLLSPSDIIVATDSQPNLGNNNNNYNYDTTDNSNYDLSNTNRQSTSPTTTTSNSSSLFINGTLTTIADDEDFKFNLFGTYIYPFRWLTLQTLYSWLGPISSLAMIIGCVLPYVPQYITIHKKQNCTGFSTFVCLTLLLANILRVAFWFGHPFEIPLLIQSGLMILAQILLLELCVRVKRRSHQHVKRSFFNFRYFWRWTSLLSYIEFLILFSILLGAAMYFLIDCDPFVETIGYCALVTESMLGLPQVIKNYKNKSVEGMSLSMVLMWLGGDTFKTGYFIANNVPFQFWLCGLLQITIDLIILFQVCLFRQNAPIKMSSRTKEDPSSPKELMAMN